MTRFVVKTRADSPELRKAAMAIEQAAWGALGFLNFTKAHFAFYQQLLDEHADYQLCLVDEATGYPVAVGNCVPLACDFNDLPPEGWDWIVETAANKDSMHRNAVGALAISVPHIHRSKGLARRMIEEFRNLAIRKGHDGVIAPVRPSAKHLHPFIPMGEYITWTDDKGRLFDPWLRSHAAAGGKIIKPADRSMTVDEPVAFWEMWRGSLPSTGEYKIEGALNPVSIDLERDSGRYVEPNVWFAYQAA